MLYGTKRSNMVSNTPTYQRISASHPRRTRMQGRNLYKRPGRFLCKSIFAMKILRAAWTIGPQSIILNGVTGVCQPPPSVLMGIATLTAVEKHDQIYILCLARDFSSKSRTTTCKIKAATANLSLGEQLGDDDSISGHGTTHDHAYDESHFLLVPRHS